MDPQNIIVDPQFVVFCLWTPGNVTWTPRVPCGPRLRTTDLEDSTDYLLQGSTYGVDLIGL